MKRLFSNTTHEIDEAFSQSHIALLDELENLEVVHIKLTESQKVELLESISVTLILSILLAAPAIMKVLAKGVGFILNLIKKLFGKEPDEYAILEKLIEIADKWHHAYIGIIEKILTFTGIFKSANIEVDDPTRHKIAEVVFYVIIFGFGIHGGIMSGKSILHMVTHSKISHLNTTVVESVLSVIKSKEVIDFVAGLGRA